MSFSTYADLKTQIANWLGRSDLTDNIPDFIRLFEAVASRKLRVLGTETTSTLTPTSGSVALPSGFLSMRRLTWAGDTQVELEYVTPPYLRAAYPDNPSATPRIYTIEAGNILVRPIDDTSLSAVYTAKTAAVESTLNWLYTNHFDIYLFGSLAEAHGFTESPELLMGWKARRDEGFDEIKTLNFNSYPGSMQVRVMGPTP